MSIYEELPKSVQSMIFADFLFRDFLIVFNKVFRFQNHFSSMQPSFYTWKDHSYTIFMNDILVNLEPR